MFVRKLSHGAGDVWVLASELSPLTSLTPALPIDARGLAGQVVFVGASRRLPRLGIRRIAASEEWHWEGAREPRVDQARWLSQRVSERGGDVRELAAEFWALTCATVRRSMEGFRSVAVMAAGGLDSSALLAAALAEARGANAKEVSAIAWHFGGHGDDRPYFAELTKALGIVPIQLDPSIAAHDVLSSMTSEGLPLTPLTVTLQTCALRAAKERGAEVMLLGSGGDEVLAGVVESAITGDSLANPLGVARAFRRAFRYRAPVDMPFKRRLGLVVRPLVRTYVPKAVRRHRMRKAFLGFLPHLGPLARELLDEFVEARISEPLPHDPTARYRAFAGRPLFEEYAEHRAQIEGAAGLPIRDPYMDDDLTRFVSSISPPLLVHGDFHRGLFREALRGHIPDKIRLRTDKASFERVVATLLQSPAVQSRARTLSKGRHSAKLGIVAADALERHVAEALSGDIDAGYVRMSFLWSALVVEAFLEEVA